MNTCYSIAVSGGIGSGKSVVCRVLMALGYDVYDCDSRAKHIMDHDANIKRSLCQKISPEAVDEKGDIRRNVISKVVFSDPAKLAALNEIVHGAIRADITRWLKQHRGPAFIETAILYQSGLDKMVDEVWEVEAPEDVRVLRVCRRSGLNAEEVKSRIAAQNLFVEQPHPLVRHIINDDCHSLLLQVNALLESINIE